MEAAKHLVKITPQAVLNTRTTGSQPRGNTCLHLACDGSDKTWSRADLVNLLVEHKASLEERTTTGNTAFLLASGTGVTDTIQALVDCRADVNAHNDRQLGGFQSANRSSGSARRLLQENGLARPKEWVASGRQRTGVGESRQTRYMFQGQAWQDDDWRGGDEKGWDWRGGEWSGWRGGKWDRNRDRDWHPRRR